MGDGSHLLKHVRRLAAGADASDAGLLRRFAAAADPEVFAELVRRHGPAVLGVCRRVLRNDADADDAFQAAFLVLARRAGSVRGGGVVGSWLYGVARHVAIRLRDKTARRQRHERAAAAARSLEVGGGPAGDDLRVVLDDELARLPERERAAVLACLVRGLTQEQAAAELGWSLSTVRRRLDGGRERLRLRLARRLGEVPAALLAGGTVAVSPAMVGATSEAAVLFAAGVRAGTPAVLAMGELAMMTRAKLAVLAGAVVAAAGLAAGGAAVWPSAQADDPKPAAKADPPAKPAELAAKPTPPAAPVPDELIRPGERLKITALGHHAGAVPVVFDGVRVEPTGKVPLGIGNGGRVKIAGLTVEAAEAMLADHFLATWRRGEAPQVEVVRLDWVAAAAPGGEARIKPGDRLRVQHSIGQAITGDYTEVLRVEAAGTLPLGPRVGRVPVAGLTTAEAEAAVGKHLQKVYNLTSPEPAQVSFAETPADERGRAGGGDLAERVRRLEAEVAELKKQVAELRKK
ncbi:MAG: sigma-70 family RNA polymerase sigma factor [Gemmataceae bacterium]|nr:sigma-70 family RNA polymerase sigma factor [Gemmataceae bacterium]